MIYVRCINCLYNTVAKGICLLDKKAFLCLYKKKIVKLRAFERYISLENKTCLMCLNNIDIVLYSIGCTECSSTSDFGTI